MVRFGPRGGKQRPQTMRINLTQDANLSDTIAIPPRTKARYWSCRAW